MPISISIEDIYPIRIVIDRENQVVKMSYFDVDNNGNQQGNLQEAYFWATIPDPGTDPDGNPYPIPDNWYQLPPAYQSGLFQMVSDAVAAIKQRRGI